MQTLVENCVVLQKVCKVSVKCYLFFFQEKEKLSTVPERRRSGESHDSQMSLEGRRSSGRKRNRREVQSRDCQSAVKKVSRIFMLL